MKIYLLRLMMIFSERFFQKYEWFFKLWLYDAIDKQYGPSQGAENFYNKNGFYKQAFNKWDFIGK